MFLGEVEATGRAYKMSKSRGNVVNPDVVVADYGADALRLYEMFMGPLEATKPWSMEGVSGVRKFLDRAWRMIVDEHAERLVLSDAVEDIEPTAEQNRVLHRTIQEVTHDVAHLEFNTAIAHMMEFTNYFLKQQPRPKKAMEALVLLLSPFAPHIGEELWQALGNSGSLAYQPWPHWDAAAIELDEVEVIVQVNGKMRGKVNVPAGSGRDDVAAAARGEKRIAELLDGKRIANVVFVPDRLMNFVLEP
jgi:leucyl-tRNA synthetase